MENVKVFINKVNAIAHNYGFTCSFSSVINKCELSYNITLANHDNELSDNIAADLRALFEEFGLEYRNENDISKVAFVYHISHDWIINRGAVEYTGTIDYDENLEYGAFKKGTKFHRLVNGIHRYTRQDIEFQSIACHCGQIDILCINNINNPSEPLSYNLRGLVEDLLQECKVPYDEKNFANGFWVVLPNDWASTIGKEEC